MTVIVAESDCSRKRDSVESSSFLPVYRTNCSPNAIAGIADVNKMYVEGAKILQLGTKVWSCVPVRASASTGVHQICRTVKQTCQQLIYMNTVLCENVLCQASGQQTIGSSNKLADRTKLAAEHDLRVQAGASAR